MGWYFRKSISLGGGTRLNFSKSGMGISTGIRGLRFGMDARGRHYINCGTHGIYYRQYIGGSSHAVNPSPPNNGSMPQARSGTGATQYLHNGQVSNMVDVSASDTLAEIRRRHAQILIWPFFVGLMLAVAILSYSNDWTGFTIGAFVLLAVGTPILIFIDLSRKRLSLTYTLDKPTEIRYTQFLQGFANFRSAHKMWAIDSRSAVSDPKYHAGASTTVGRTAIYPNLALPSYFRCNLTPPMLPAGRRRLYFFPDTILVFEGSVVGSIAYADLLVQSGTSTFIEEDAPPQDSLQVSTTWRFVNKSGGPDRRFSNNRQLPIMQYGSLSLQTRTGFNEQFQISRATLARQFELDVRQMSRPNSPSPTTASATSFRRP